MGALHYGSSGFTTKNPEVKTFNGKNPCGPKHFPGDKSFSALGTKRAPGEWINFRIGAKKDFFQGHKQYPWNPSPLLGGGNPRCGNHPSGLMPVLGTIETVGIPKNLFGSLMRS